MTVVAENVICPGGTIIPLTLLMSSIVVGGGCGLPDPCVIFFPWRENSETIEWLHPEFTSMRLFEWYSNSVYASLPCTRLRRFVEGGWGLIQDLGCVQFNLERNVKALFKENKRLRAEVKNYNARL
ncbi:hypothetical protein V6N13_055140 [Hibiscus sabdariffa]